MRLDRNTKGYGKYGLILRRKLTDIHENGGKKQMWQIEDALDTLERAGLIDWGATPETEFFVMRLRDLHAGSALNAYAQSADMVDAEYARDVEDLARRAGLLNPFCKRPD